jgi:hypothetical protein
MAEAISTRQSTLQRVVARRAFLGRVLRNGRHKERTDRRRSPCFSGVRERRPGDDLYHTTDGEYACFVGLSA